MNTGPTDLAPVVARYLDELQAHQARFLDAVVEPAESFRREIEGD